MLYEHFEKEALYDNFGSSIVTTFTLWLWEKKAMRFKVLFNLATSLASMQEHRSDTNQLWLSPAMACKMRH